MSYLAWVVVSGTPTDPADEEVPGSYSIEVRDDVPVEKRVTVVLDCFHRHVGIEEVDDFDVEVFGPDGMSLVEPQGVDDSGGWSQKADFMGKLEPGYVAPVPT